ncbi:MAG: hypothetical protein KTR16_05255 [Acidiferrobacterales bacterium]|nr:hypothetical protein [Acidiferrobacterales bacterium]
MQAFNSLANNRLWNKHGVNIIWLLALVVLLLVLLSVGWNAWNTAKTKQVNYQPREVAPLRIATKQNYNVNDIVSANLFGDPSPAPVVQVAPKKTTLNLTLEGVLWSSDNLIGRAIIMSGKKAAILYSLGEEIQGAGAKVEEIRDNEVILNRNGALESLPLKKILDSKSGIVVNYPDPMDEIINDYDTTQDSVPINRQSASNQQSNVSEIETSDGETKRVRRPNFSGLDRALEKMGEL